MRQWFTTPGTVTSVPLSSTLEITTVSSLFPVGNKAFIDSAFLTVVPSDGSAKLHIAAAALFLHIYDAGGNTILEQPMPIAGNWSQAPLPGATGVGIRLPAFAGLSFYLSDIPATAGYPATFALHAFVSLANTDGAAAHSAQVNIGGLAEYGV